MITKAFKTTSNIGLTILANVPLVYLTIEKENEMHHIIHGQKKFKWKDEFFTRNEIMVKYDLWQDHPADRVEYCFSKEADNTLKNKIYTDGSKAQNNVGAAFIILNDENCILDSKQ